MLPLISLYAFKATFHLVLSPSLPSIFKFQNLAYMPQEVSMQ